MIRDSERESHEWTRRGVLGSAVAAAVAVLPASVAGQEQNVDALFVGHDEQSFSRTRMGVGFALGLADRVRASVRFGDENSTIGDHVEETVDEFEDHREEWISYVNTRGLGGEDHQSLGLTFEFDGGTERRYVLADWDGNEEEYASVEIVEEVDDDPDVTATLSDYATENAAGELQELHEKYIAPDEDIDQSHKTRLAGRYIWGEDHVTASFLGSE